jgi:class 3 adenylate cyclase
MTDEELARLAEAEVYDPAAIDAADQRHLLERLVAQGLTVEDLATANRLGDIVLRAFEHLILPGERSSVADAADATRLTVEQVLTIRRAWGLGDPKDDERLITPPEIEALEFVRDTAGFVGPDLALHAARVMGTAMSRIAEAEIALVRSRLEAPMQERHESGAAMLGLYATVLEGVLPAALRTLDALHRAHLVAIGRRYSDWALPPTEHNVVDLVVGFADLTHSTTLVQQLDLAGLDRAITAFEATTSDVIAAAGATVVKRLGDGVMFVTSEPEVACRVALDLVDAFRNHPLAPPVRVGVAAGLVAALRGDFFGPAVHLAARIVSAAPPATVLVSDDVRARVADVVAGLVFTPEGAHTLAGFVEPIKLHRLTRAVPTPVAARP